MILHSVSGLLHIDDVTASLSDFAVFRRDCRVRCNQLDREIDSGDAP